jgi:hypothetical protein
MQSKEAKYQTVKEAVRQALKPEPTPKIPGLAVRPGTGTALVPPVPANLNIPNYARNPRNMSAEAVAFLCLPYHPCRLNLWQGSVLSGFSEEDLYRLYRLGLIPASNEGKGTTVYFSKEEFLKIMNNADLVRELTTTLNRLNREINEEKALRREQRRNGSKA